jgi:hypothetical protein
MDIIKASSILMDTISKNSYYSESYKTNTMCAPMKYFQSASGLSKIDTEKAYRSLVRSGDIITKSVSKFDTRRIIVTDKGMSRAKISSPIEGTYVPEKPTTQMIEYAKASHKLSKEETLREFEIFFAYHHNEDVSKNWHIAWRNWLRSRLKTEPTQSLSDHVKDVFSRIKLK